jgi:transcriptional regulator with XRE-family HTH domain
MVAYNDQRYSVEFLANGGPELTYVREDRFEIAHTLYQLMRKQFPDRTVVLRDRGRIVLQSGWSIFRFKSSGIFSMPKKKSPVDAIVGRNIRIYRLAKGLSQAKLASDLGVSFQQIQKYEKGVNRVGSGRLYQISTILGVSVTSFFQGAASATREKATSPYDLLADPLSLRLIQSFSEISSRRAKSAVVSLLEAIALSKKSWVIGFVQECLFDQYFNDWAPFVPVGRCSSIKRPRRVTQ